MMVKGLKTPKIKRQYLNAATDKKLIPLLLTSTTCMVEEPRNIMFPIDKAIDACILKVFYYIVLFCLTRQHGRANGNFEEDKFSTRLVREVLFAVFVILFIINDKYVTKLNDKKEKETQRSFHNSHIQFGYNVGAWMQKHVR